MSTIRQHRRLHETMGNEKESYRKQKNENGLKSGEMNNRGGWKPPKHGSFLAGVVVIFSHMKPTRLLAVTSPRTRMSPTVVFAASAFLY